MLTRTSDGTWQRDVTLGANPLTITFGYVLDAMCMAAEFSAIVSPPVPQNCRTPRSVSNGYESP